MKLMFVLGLVLVIFLQEVLCCGGGGGSGSGGGGNRKYFKQICSSNPSNSMRGLDRFGSGSYGAPRGGRTHKGIDIKCSAYSSVYAPFDAKVVRVARPYGNGKPHDTGVLLQGRGDWAGYSVKMFYVNKSVGNGQKVYGGSYIGSM